MENGYIHKISSIIVTICYYTNLVEGIKWVFGTFTKEKKRKFKNFAIDTFILIKWLFLGLIWTFNYQSTVLTVLVCYLIWSNLFTYFYYHVWSTRKADEVDRSQRRFINLILAFSFSNFCFAYLYSLPFKTSFIVASGFEGRFSFLMYSSYNSLFSNYKFIEIGDMAGIILTISQQIITFIFISILLTKSIPE